MYLVDTNIFLEELLHQRRTAEVRSFFLSIDLDTIFMTDFSLHSVGIILFKKGKHPVFTSFLEDVVGDVHVLSLSVEDLKTLDQPIQRFNLDFDDAYQYAVAQKYNLQLISFDRDFDRTDIERKEPIDIVK